MIKYELKKIIRNKFIILIVLVLILPIFLNNPIIVNINLDGGIIDFVNDFRMISIFSVPLVVSIIFDENINKAESYPIFTQPISLLRILCSKLGVIIAIYIIAGGIGENGIDARKQICAYLEFMGVKIDNDKNNCRGKEVEISTDDSKVKVYVVPTNEELMIARDTKELVSK